MPGHSLGGGLVLVLYCTVLYCTVLLLVQGIGHWGSLTLCHELGSDTAQASPGSTVLPEDRGGIGQTHNVLLVGLVVVGERVVITTVELL